MVLLTRSTKSINEKDIKRDWHVIDIKGRVLGRVTGEIAKLLQGKHKANYTPHMDMGDHVIVINSKHLVLTGKKLQQKYYTKYSGYPGGLKSVNAQTVLQKNPSELVRHAVSGMLPKNKLRDRRLTRLHIFPDKEHTYVNKI